MGSSASNGPKRILIVDDHPLYRSGLRQFLESQPDLACCGEADTRQKALEAATKLKPDLVTLDLRLRGEDALDSLKDILARQAKLPVLILTQKDESLYAESALKAGARGYIMKEEATEELLNAIRQVLGGDVYVSRRLSGLILNRYLTGAKADGLAGKLSDRELQVFEFIGRGLGMHQIAEQLHLSIKTVETHRENIKHKLGFGDAIALAAAARDWVEGGER